MCGRLTYLLISTGFFNKRRSIPRELMSHNLRAMREEQDRGLSLPTFGMRLEGVTLRNGVALIKFSQPAGVTNYGSQGPFVFEKAIERTARQFPTVKRVEICAIGETLIYSQLEKPFPRCAK